MSNSDLPLTTEDDLRKLGLTPEILRAKFESRGWVIKGKTVSITPSPSHILPQVADIWFAPPFPSTAFTSPRIRNGAKTSWSRRGILSYNSGRLLTSNRLCLFSSMSTTRRLRTSTATPRRISHLPTIRAWPRGQTIVSLIVTTLASISVWLVVPTYFLFLDQPQFAQSLINVLK